MKSDCSNAADQIPVKYLKLSAAWGRMGGHHELFITKFEATHWDCCLVVAEWLVRPSGSKSYAGGVVYTPGRASQAGKVKE